ncbi:UpxY family transcription antiterminator [Flavitalea sp. BT771]|uniref:UpxY family transcription antiterminator n=1 Tax=Flavitalea sp. BT771 TaxID=3063329 RepID=UPI0026E32943|nr:UpxY family transcription antiterminator [Flavitalea sp. BT771]MDO6434168.1 UpxY family transcription antiterminator [Flavitalea sp. BT771]MDV6223068.1 UpxY family transcription antiterminator [Flavitalea sp. BT771]
MQVKERSWYAVYTKPRWEKKVYSLLSESGFEAYCPLNKVRKKWSDRVKWLEEPLFKSYVFVYIGEDEQTKVRMTNGVVNFVYWLGRPAIVLDKEIQIIRKFLNEYTDVRAESLDLEANEKIKIQRGVLMNQEAKVVKVLNNKVKVIIESIGYSLVAVIERSNAILVRK